MSRPTISSIFETLSQGPAPVPAPPPVTPSRFRLPADIIPPVQPLVWAAPSRSQSLLPADKQEAAMLQEPVLQALLHLHPAEYRELLEFASKPIWLQLTLIRHEQMEAARWRTAVDARLTEAMTPAQTGDGERAFELPIAVQDAINTHVRRWCVLHVAGQFQGLTWNTLFTGHVRDVRVVNVVSEDISDPDLALLLSSSSDSFVADYLNEHLQLTGNRYLSARPSVPLAAPRLGWLLYELDGERFKLEVRASRPMS
ncbi:hypothetical protein RI367_005226 [Sorochytrium milnesiophthora]